MRCTSLVRLDSQPSSAFRANIDPRYTAVPWSCPAGCSHTFRSWETVTTSTPTQWHWSWCDTTGVRCASCRDCFLHPMRNKQRMLTLIVISIDLHIIPRWYKWQMKGTHNNCPEVQHVLFDIIRIGFCSLHTHHHLVTLTAVVCSTIYVRDSTLGDLVWQQRTRINIWWIQNQKAQCLKHYSALHASFCCQRLRPMSMQKLKGMHTFPNNTFLLYTKNVYMSAPAESLSKHPQKANHSLKTNDMMHIV